MNRNIFGAEDLYKETGQGNKKKDYTLEESSKILKGADLKLDLVENKFISGQEITDEEFKEAEQAIGEVDDLLNYQIGKHKESLCEKIENLPSALAPMFIDSAIRDIGTIIATLSYKRAVIKLIRQKYNKKGSITCDTGDLKNEEKAE
jgi:hypothetical protein